MANLMGESKTLSSKFVFYQQLAESQNQIAQDRYKAVMNAGENLLSLSQPSSRASHIASSLRAQAKNEAKKEAELLNTYFQCNFSIDDMFDKQVGIEITKSLNEALNLKDIFERNVDRIMNAKNDPRANKTTITSIMEGYLITEMREQWDNIANAILDRLAQTNGESPIEDAVDFVFDSPLIDGIVEKALERAMKSSTWTDSDDEPFKELMEYLDSHSNQKTYILQQMWRNLGIENLRTKMKETIKDSEQLKNFKRNLKKNPINMETAIKKGTRKGLMAEAFSQVIAEAARSLNSSNVKFSTEQTGGIGVKPDVFMTYGLKMDTLTDMLRSDRFVGASREQNRARFIEINEHLKRLNKGFIIYSNVKDYTIGKDFERRGGCSTGEDMKLRTYNNIMSRTKSNELIGAIANTIEGAVFDSKKYEEAITEFIAQDMANFLFDDVFTIGKEMTKGATAIHLMNLNGIYIPVSYLMLLLAEAFESEEKKNYQDIFKPYIKSNFKIEYPEGGIGEDGQITPNKWTNEDWIRQRDIALDKIYVGAHFARSFADLIEEMMR